MDASKGAMDPQVSNRFNRLLLSLADVHGALIKLADRLAALRKAPEGSPLHLKLAHEALDVYAPIANRMGVWSIKAAMEDLAFKVPLSSGCCRFGRLSCCEVVLLATRVWGGSVNGTLIGTCRSRV